jgi:MoaA/NifB/PqqE/SkfB family radical SAM enzyme
MDNLTYADPGRYDRVNLEITNACNLRCVYCHQSNPDSVFDQHMREDWFDLVVDFCRDHKLGMIDFTGGGETTFARGWQDKCRRVLDQGIKLHLTTNLAELLSWEDAKLLARFAHLYISIDTIDRELLRRIRRHVDVRSITHNLLQIRAAARAQNLPKPFIAWNCVGTDIALGQLDRMASVAICAGIDEFKILDLRVWDFMNKDPDTPPLRHPAALAKEEFLPVYGAYKRGVEIFAGSKTAFWIQPSLADSLEDKYRAVTDPAPVTADADVAHMHYDVTDGAGWEVWAKQPEDGMTRDCMDPWSFMQIISNGQVRPCCFGAKPIGNLNDGRSLAEIINGPEARQLRQEMLTGNLSHACRQCHARGLVPAAEFQEKIARRTGAAAPRRRPAEARVGVASTQEARETAG